MSNFQEELRNDDGYENIVIIAIGQTNIDQFNNNFCANSDLPLVMDTYPGLPIREQFSPYGESHYLVILNYDGNYIGHIDLLSLGNTEKNYIRGVLQEYYNQVMLGDINGDNILNILDIVILVDLILTDIYNEIGDMNSDEGLNIQDIILILNSII